MAIEACLRCGSRHVVQLTLQDGLAAGGGELTGTKVCRRCDWQGIPAEFEDTRSYAAFLRGLADATEDIVAT